MSKIGEFFSIKKMVKPDQIVGEMPTSKKIYRRTFDLAWPSAVEAVLISLIGSVDLMMVGGISPSAIAAVGITNQPKFLMMATIMALNVGVTVIVSRRKGQNKPESANSILRNAILISILLSLLFSILGYVFAPEILSVAGATADYAPLAIVYFKYIMIGNFFTCVGLTMTSAQRGAGNTKISMITNLTANLVNVVFNYLLINGIWIFPELGVEGAAIATMIGNIVAFFMAIYSISKAGGFLHINLKQDWRLKKDNIQQLIKISSSAFIEQIFLRIGFFVYAMSVAGLGMLAFATHQVCMTIMNLSFAVGDGLSIASSSLVGQMLGAKRPDLAIVYSKAVQKIGLIIAFCLMVLMMVFRTDLLHLFTTDLEIIKTGSEIIIVLAVTVSMQILQVITVGSLRGAGDVKFVAALSIVSVAILRPILTYVLIYPAGLGLIGAWIAVFIDQGLRNIVSQWRFKQSKWTKIVL